jgi:hypothetical protein
MRAVAVAGACLVAIAGCGGSATTTSQSKQAEIAAGLRDLRVLRLPRGHCDSLGCSVPEYTIGTKPPKGISPAEWRAAIRGDTELPTATRQALLK